MKKQYKIQLPKGKKVTMTNVDFEDGVMTVNVELENRKEQKYEPKDGDFIFVESRLKPYVTKYSYIGIFHDIIKDDGFSTILLMYASLKDEGRLVCGNSIEPYINAEYIRPATEEEKKLLIDKLAKVNKRWNEEKKCLEDVRWRAKEGDFVYVKAGYEHIAIFKEKVDEDMYVYADWNMSFSVSKIIIDDSRPLCCIHDLREIRPTTEREKKILIDKLAEVNKKWNEEKKCLEDARWRAKDGEPYYYLLIGDTDILVTTTTDMRMYKDDERFNSGNYFKTDSDAEKVAEQIREIFKNSKAE